jgi:cephalosporin hydroxylase
MTSSRDDTRSAARLVAGAEEAGMQAVRAFHELYYGSPDTTWKNTRWQGVRAQKCPLDLWVYQEILHEVQPDLIVETGTAEGGSAFFLASMLDLLGRGAVVTIDVLERPDYPRHPRITYLHGSSTDPSIVGHVGGLIGPDDRVVVILDSDHGKGHVLDEMRAYAPCVSRGSYLIVEDTNINGHPVLPEFGPGPWEAVEEFLQENDQFEVDRSREKFLMTFNPMGYLRRQ